MAASSLAQDTGKTKGTGGTTTNALGPLAGLDVTITIRTTK